MSVTIREDENIRAREAEKFIYSIKRKMEKVDHCEGGFVKECIETCLTALELLKIFSKSKGMTFY